MQEKQIIGLNNRIRILRYGSLRVVFFLVTLILTFPVIYAQGTINRPCIGLALSGGGALGIAHLGLLKVMEESGLRPDYISGVSMGSVIGGMYSIGYSSDSILNILRTMDLNGAMINKIPEDKIIYLEKRNFQNSIMSFPITSRKVFLPSGLTNGQVIENFLSFYAWPAADINDFSKLPIPFVCIGSDILTARAVDIRKGYLPDAIRASISIPSVFTPIKIDSSLLLDGGIYRNFAPQEVIDMGADIVIGSYTGFRWRGEKELESLPDIIKQISFSFGYSDYEEQKKLVNYFVVPNLKGFSSMDFTKVDSIYQRGYKAALPFRKEFTKLADSLNKIGLQKPLDNIMNKEYYAFDRIDITGNKNYSDKQIMGILEISAGEYIDKYLLKEKIELLHGKTWFEKIKYRIEPKNDSLILEIECIEKPIAVLYGSLHYDNALLSGVLLSFSAKNFLTPGSVLTIDTYIGQYYRFNALLLQYIGWKQNYSISTNIYTDNTLIPLLHLRNESGHVISRDLSFEVDLARRFGLNQMLRIQGGYENLNLMPQYISSSGIDNITYNYFRGSMHYGINSLDNKHFPNSGTIMDISGSTSKMLSASIRTDFNKDSYDIKNKGDFFFDWFYTLKFNFRQYFSSGNKVTLSLRTDVVYVSKCDSAMSQNNFYLLGGLQPINGRSIPMTGFHSFEVPVKKAAGAGFEVDIEAFKNFHISLMTDIFLAQDIYRETGSSLLAGVGAGAGYMSIIGPIKIGIMYGNDPEKKYFNRLKGYISIGYNF